MSKKGGDMLLNGISYNIYKTAITTIGDINLEGDVPKGVESLSPSEAFHLGQFKGYHWVQNGPGEIICCADLMPFYGIDTDNPGSIGLEDLWACIDRDISELRELNLQTHTYGACWQPRFTVNGHDGIAREVYMSNDTLFNPDGTVDKVYGRLKSIPPPRELHTK